MDPKDDKNQDQAAVPAPQGGVMDIQPPKSGQGIGGAPVVEPQGTTPENQPVVSTSDFASVPTVKPDAPKITQDPEAPEAVVAPKKPGLSPELLAQAESEFKKPEEEKSADGKNPLLAAHAPHKKRGPMVAVVIAIIIALALAGVAVYAYMQSQKEKDYTDHDINPTHQENIQPAAQPVTSKDVDDAAKELDNTINATDEAQEIPEAGLTEESVGL